MRAVGHGVVHATWRGVCHADVSQESPTNRRKMWRHSVMDAVQS